MTEMTKSRRVLIFWNSNIIHLVLALAYYNNVDCYSRNTLSWETDSLTIPDWETWLHPSRLGITSRSNGGVEIGMSSLTVFTDIQLEPPMNSLSLSSTPATVCLFHVVLLMKVPIRGFCYTTHISRGFTWFRDPQLAPAPCHNRFEDIWRLGTVPETAVLPNHLNRWTSHHPLQARERVS